MEQIAPDFKKIILDEAVRTMDNSTEDLPDVVRRVAEKYGFKPSFRDITDILFYDIGGQGEED